MGALQMQRAIPPLAGPAKSCPGEVEFMERGPLFARAAAGPAGVDPTRVQPIGADNRSRQSVSWADQSRPSQIIETIVILVRVVGKPATRTAGPQAEYFSTEECADMDEIRKRDRSGRRRGSRVVWLHGGKNSE